MGCHPDFCHPTQLGILHFVDLTWRHYSVNVAALSLASIALLG